MDIFEITFALKSTFESWDLGFSQKSPMANSY